MSDQEGITLADDLKGIPKGAFAIVTKIHHAAMDGISASELFTTIHDFSPQPRERVIEDKSLPTDPRPSVTDLLFRASQNSFRRMRGSGDMLQKVAKAYGRIRKGKQAGRLKEQLPAPTTRFNTEISAHRVVTSLRLLTGVVMPRFK